MTAYYADPCSSCQYEKQACAYMLDGKNPEDACVSKRIWLKRPKCAKCGDDILLWSSDEEPKRINGESVCRNCYFGELGNMMEQHPPGIHPMYRKTEIVTAGYYDWHKKREEIPVSALVGGTIVQFEYGNNFIVWNPGKYYEIVVDETPRKHRNS